MLLFFDNISLRNMAIYFFTACQRRYCNYGVFFFLLGFNSYIGAVTLFFILYGAIFDPDILSIRPHRSYVFMSVLLLLFLVPIYFFGSGISIASPAYRGLVIIVIAIIYGLFLQGHSIGQIKMMLIWYISGMSFEVFTVIVYNILLGQVDSGYGKLILPLNSQVVNSPGYSNILIYTFVVATYGLFLSGTVIRTILSIAVLVASIIGALYLGGRTFFVVSLLSSLFVLYSQFRKNHYLVMTLYLVFIIYVVLSLVSHYYSFAFDGYLIGRFNGEALASLRWPLWLYGLQELCVNPLGGYNVVDSQVPYSQPWFHNVFLDAGRIAGWLPVGSLLLMMLYSVAWAIKSGLKCALHYDGMLFFVLIYIVSIAIMIQDVVLEGEYRSILLLFFSGLAIRKVHDEAHCVI